MHSIWYSRACVGWFVVVDATVYGWGVLADQHSHVEWCVTAFSQRSTPGKLPLEATTNVNVEVYSAHSLWLVVIQKRKNTFVLFFSFLLAVNVGDETVFGARPTRHNPPSKSTTRGITLNRLTWLFCLLVINWSDHDDGYYVGNCPKSVKCHRG